MPSPVLKNISGRKFFLLLHTFHGLTAAHVNPGSFQTLFMHLFVQLYHFLNEFQPNLYDSIGFLNKFLADKQSAALNCNGGQKFKDKFLRLFINLQNQQKFHSQNIRERLLHCRLIVAITRPLTNNLDTHLY